MRRHHRSILIASIATLVLVGASCGDDDSDDTTPAPAATDSTEAPTAETEATAGFQGDLIGTFAIDAAVCSDAAVTGSYFRMQQPSGDFVPNTDSSCADQTYTALAPGTDGGLVTGTTQPAPEPAFDSAGNGLAGAIFEPVKFYAVDFAGATESGGAVPSLTASDGGLTGDLSAFSAYYANAVFNQGAPKPDGSGEPPAGTIDPETGAYVLEWTSLIVGGSFDGFTGVWHLEGTFSAS